MNSYNNFSTLRLVSFKKPRYHSNRMQCRGINKEENEMLINAKRSTSKTKSKKSKTKQYKTKTTTTTTKTTFREEMFSVRKFCG